MSLQLLLLPLALYFQANWQTYTDLNGRFQVDVPGPMAEKTDTLHTAVGELVYHSFVYQAKPEGSDNEAFIVSYCDYPEGIVFADSSGLVEDFFQTTIEASAESISGSVLYAVDVQLNGHPGKFWRVDYLDGKGIIKTKAYLVKNRYYTTQVISYHKQDLSGPTDRFFNSFRLLIP